MKYLFDTCALVCMYDNKNFLIKNKIKDDEWIISEIVEKEFIEDYCKLHNVTDEEKEEMESFVENFYIYKYKDEDLLKYGYLEKFEESLEDIGCNPEKERGFGEASILAYAKVKSSENIKIVTNDRNARRKMQKNSVYAKLSMSLDDFSMEKNK